MPGSQRTPLADTHLKLGARMVDFAGWWMPVQYQGLKEEHLGCRTGIGLFDVSHMGEIRVRGAHALATVQWLTSNDASVLKAGDAQYSLLCNEMGGVVDDLFVYCLVPETDYLLCVNAANTEKDYAHIQKNNKGADLENESSKWGQIAVQGPNALKLLDLLFKANAQVPSTLARNKIAEMTWDGGKVLLARTGYTGEDGAEIFVPRDHTVALWSRLLEAGKPFGVTPVGLGARDTLRTEMKYSLYGHEIDDTTSPLEAGLGWVVKPSAKDFLGRHKILEKKEAGIKRSLIGLKLLEKGIPRQGYPVLSPAGEKIGICTSGTLSPSTGEPIAIAFVDVAFKAPGTRIGVEIRGKTFSAEVCPTPFVRTTSLQTQLAKPNSTI